MEQLRDLELAIGDPELAIAARGEDRKSKIFKEQRRNVDAKTNKQTAKQQTVQKQKQKDGCAKPRAAKTRGHSPIRRCPAIIQYQRGRHATERSYYTKNNLTVYRSNYLAEAA